MQSQQQECLQPCWKDITSFLDEATKDFDVGQLVHVPSFTLFDAMNAIEMMDPRMDTGMSLDEERQPFDIHRRLSAKQTIYVMDRLITLEMAWIEGHQIPQTVFTCIYLHHLRELNEIPMPTIESDVEEIVFGALKSYLLATAKCCHYVYMEMLNRNVFEQEDFSSTLYGLTLNDQRPNELICNEISASIYLLRNLIKTEAYDVNILLQILYRVEMRYSYLMSFICLSQDGVTYLPQARIELKRVAQALKDIDLTINDVYPDAFDPHINRKLTTQAPPRTVQLPSETQSFENYNLLIERLLSICSIVEYPNTNSLMIYFEYFGAQRPYPDAFVRSKLNTLFYQQNKHIFGNIPVRQMIFSSVKETVQPPLWWLVSYPSYAPSRTNQPLFTKAHEELNKFCERISTFFVEYVRINFHNRSRQRRLLLKLIPHWERIQIKASHIDELFHQLHPYGEHAPYYFSSWVYHFKLHMMEKILLLGFELDLYGENEYIMIYWYLQNVFGARAFLLQRIVRFVDRTIDAITVLEFLHSNQLLNQAKKCLSEAILKILMVAKYTKQFDQQATVFDDERTRYIHRFGKFINLQSPAHPTYETYVAKMHTDQFNVDYMMEMIKQDLAKSKQILESLVIMTAKETSTQMCHGDFVKEITSLLHTTVFNMNRLKHIPGDSTISMEFKYHAWFPIINVKKK